MDKNRLAALSLVLLGLSACSQTYSSKVVALSTCNGWAEQGPSINYEETLSREDALEVFRKKNPEPEEGFMESLGNAFMEQEGRLDKWNRDFERYLYTNPTQELTVEAYSCVEEDKTREVLGYANNSISDGTWKNEDGQRGYKKIVRYFRY